MEIVLILTSMLAWTLTVILGTFFTVGTFLDGMCAFLFIYHAFIKKTKYYSTAFFYILSIGYVFDILTSVVAFFSTISKNDIFIGISEILLYYNLLLLGPWNTLMAINRFTAIWFWKNHEWYWRNKFFIPALIGMLAYPILVSIPIIIGSKVYCFFHAYEETCIDVLIKAAVVSIVSNGIHVIICAILGIITSLASRFNIIAVTPETKKIQQFLLIQSILSLIFFGFNMFHTLHGGISDNPILENIVETISQKYSVFFRLSSTLLLLLLSKNVRQSFASFYQCCCCCCCKKKSSKTKRKILIQPKNEVKVV